MIDSWDITETTDISGGGLLFPCSGCDGCRDAPKVFLIRVGPEDVDPPLPSGIDKVLSPDIHDLVGPPINAFKVLLTDNMSRAARDSLESFWPPGFRADLTVVCCSWFAEGVADGAVLAARRRGTICL